MYEDLGKGGVNRRDNIIEPHLQKNENGSNYSVVKNIQSFATGVSKKRTWPRAYLHIVE